mmetsp:Transcript_40591/g.53443  ORF Transcript_40591/g.53443 Transcript_40591/m.53443 type:complete len:276 (-) Transcript_40591:198-1025(-)
MGGGPRGAIRSMGIGGPPFSSRSLQNPSRPRGPPGGEGPRRPPGGEGPRRSLPRKKSRSLSSYGPRSGSRWNSLSLERSRGGGPARMLSTRSDRLSRSRSLSRSTRRPRSPRNHSRSNSFWRSRDGYWSATPSFGFLLGPLAVSVSPDFTFRLPAPSRSFLPPVCSSFRRPLRLSSFPKLRCGSMNPLPFRTTGASEESEAFLRWSLSLPLSLSFSLSLPLSLDSLGREEGLVFLLLSLLGFRSLSLPIASSETFPPGPSWRKRQSARGHPLGLS